MHRLNATSPGLKSPILVQGSPDVYSKQQTGRNILNSAGGSSPPALALIRENGLKPGPPTWICQLCREPAVAGGTSPGSRDLQNLFTTRQFVRRAKLILLRNTDKQTGLADHMAVPSRQPSIRLPHGLNYTQSPRKRSVTFPTGQRHAPWHRWPE